MIQVTLCRTENYTLMLADDRNGAVIYRNDDGEQVAHLHGSRYRTLRDDMDAMPVPSLRNVERLLANYDDEDMPDDD